MILVNDGDDDVELLNLNSSVQSANSITSTDAFDISEYKKDDSQIQSEINYKGTYLINN